MWIKKLKQKKLQFSLVAIILFFAAIIFSACLSFTVETGKYTTNLYKNGNCPELFLNVNGRDITPLLKEQKENQDINRIFTLEGTKVSGDMNVNGHKISNLMTSFFAIDNYKKLPWKVELSKGEKTLCPKEGKIWITRLYADLNHIKIGDVIKIKGKNEVTLKVSAFMNNILSPSSTVSFYQIYINKNDLINFPETDKCTYVTLDTKKDVSQAERIVDRLPGDFTKNLNMKLSKEDLITSLTMNASIFGGVGTMAALMIFIVSIVIIRFILKSTLTKEYKAIGVYKALGFSNQFIRGFYFKCYVVVGVIAITLGALAGLPVSNYIGSIVLKYTGHFSVTDTTIMTIFITIFLMSFLLISNVSLSLRKINKITPIEAFRIGITSTKEKLKKSFIKNAHSPFAVATNDIMKHKGMSIMIIMILTVSVFLSVFFSTINYSINSIKNNSNEWFLVPKADCVISKDITSDKIKIIQESKYVKSINYGNYYITSPIKPVKMDKKLDFSNTAIVSYYDCSKKTTGIHYLEGHGPKHPKEISFGYKQIENTGYQVGDYIDLLIGGMKTSYLITGIHSGMINNGRNVIVTTDELKRCKINYENTVFVMLKNPSDYKAFKSEITSKINGISIDKNVQAIKDSIKSVSDMSAPVTSLLVIAFIIFSLLNIINLLVMNNIENRKQYGILKALGFSTIYIGLKNLCKILILSIVSVVLGLTIHFLASRSIFFTLISVDGLRNSTVLITQVIGLIIAMIVFATLIFSIPLKNIKPIELMEE